jgi:hypothetical protein
LRPTYIRHIEDSKLTDTVSRQLAPVRLSLAPPPPSASSSSPAPAPRLVPPALSVSRPSAFSSAAAAAAAAASRYAFPSPLIARLRRHRMPRVACRHLKQ